MKIFSSLAIVCMLASICLAAPAPKTTKTDGTWTFFLMQTTCYNGGCTSTDQNGTSWYASSLAQWTLPQNAIVTRVEVTTTAPTDMYTNSGTWPPSGSCPLGQAYIQLTDGTSSYNVPIVNDGSTLYTDSGALSYAFAAGAKLQALSHFPQEQYQSSTNTYTYCYIPAGNVTVSYTTQ